MPIYPMLRFSKEWREWTPPSLCAAGDRSSRRSDPSSNALCISAIERMPTSCAPDGRKQEASGQHMRGGWLSENERLTRGQGWAKTSRSARVLVVYTILIVEGGKGPTENKEMSRQWRKTTVGQKQTRERQCTR